MIDETKIVDIFKHELMGDGSASGIKNANTKKQHYLSMDLNMIYDSMIYWNKLEN